jgi:hypothetical protein
MNTNLIFYTYKEWRTISSLLVKEENLHVVVPLQAVKSQNVVRSGEVTAGKHIIHVDVNVPCGFNLFVLYDEGCFG